MICLSSSLDGKGEIMKDSYHIVNQNFGFNVKLLHCTLKRTLFHYPSTLQPLDRYVLTYVLEGEFKFYLKNKVFSLKAGDLYYIPMNVPMMQENKPNVPCKYYALAVVGSDAPTLFARAGLTAETPVLSLNDKTVEGKMQHIYQLCGKENFLSIAKANVEFFDLLCLLFAKNPQNKQPEKSIAHTYVEQVRRFIETNYYYDINVNDIAAALHLSRSYLSSTFKKLCGTTIKNYITEYRLTKSFDLLINTQTNISKIASSVGFTDFVTFYRAFKKKTGFSPSHYRKVYRSERKKP